MKKNTPQVLLLGLIVCIGSLLVAWIEQKPEDNGWGTYKADGNSSSYSPLTQVDVNNVDQLKLAWKFDFTDKKSGIADNIQCNPIIVDGVMYSTSTNTWVYANDAATGKLLWSYDPNDGKDIGGRNRAVTYWANGNDKRIIFSAANFLIALNAKTGKPIPTFGQNGKVNMNYGLRDAPEKIQVSMSSPGIVYKNLIIVGSRLADFYGAPPGYIRAYNCMTGKLIWIFHTIPKPGEKGYDTWPPEAHKINGGTNSWAGMAIDAKRGMVFMSLGSPTYDFYGADRKGTNLYGNCVLALDAATGKYKWHFQTVHHDIWDYDLPSPPNLVTVKQGGKTIEAVAQTSKQGFVFILNRDNGKSLFPIEERPVPASNIPGEEANPTQPFPLKPKPFARQQITENDLTHYSDKDHEALLKQFRAMRNEGLFTPPDLTKETIMFPGTRGGAEWGGSAFDPVTSHLYIRSNEAPDIITMSKLKTEATTQTVTEYGKTVYQKHCVACHGQDLKGVPGTFPSLINLKKTKTQSLVLEKIRIGGGQMPAYKGILNAKEEDAIIKFLFEVEDKTLIEIAGETKERYANRTGYRTWKDPSGNPAIKGPLGTLNALNLSTGEYDWQIPLGFDPKLNVDRENNTGMEGKSGPTITAGGLLFIGGSLDNKLRAFDKKTGKLLWETTLPSNNNANVSTYQVKGVQYVSLIVGGTAESPSGSIMTFALPGK